MSVGAAPISDIIYRLLSTHPSDHSVDPSMSFRCLSMGRCAFVRLAWGNAGASRPGSQLVWVLRQWSAWLDRTMVSSGATNHHVMDESEQVWECLWVWQQYAEWLAALLNWPSKLFLLSAYAGHAIRYTVSSLVWPLGTQGSWPCLYFEGDFAGGCSWSSAEYTRTHASVPWPACLSEPQRRPWRDRFTIAADI